MIDQAQIVEPGTRDGALLREIDLARLPRHVAVIMDGNGRWARNRGLSRIEGHRAGVDAVREVVETSARLELEALTLYAFSTENWKRPRLEVAALMTLLREYVKRELRTLVKNDIRFHPIGRWRLLEPPIVRELERAIDATSSCKGLVFNIALNYSGRQELVDAVRRIATDVAAGRLSPDAIDDDEVERRLETAGLPDPDLLIRTSGELRVSNYLLWQIAYSEIWVTDTLWPDFRKTNLLEAIVGFQKRERRYGAVLNDSISDAQAESSEEPTQARP